MLVAWRELRFQLNGSASLSQLSLQSLGIVLRNAFLNVLGSAVNQSLGFLQTQAGSLTDNLDHGDLVGAGSLQNNIKLSLLLSSGATLSGDSWQRRLRQQ